MCQQVYLSDVRQALQDYCEEHVEVDEQPYRPDDLISKFDEDLEFDPDLDFALLR